MCEHRCMQEKCGKAHTQQWWLSRPVCTNELPVLVCVLRHQTKLHATIGSGALTEAIQPSFCIQRPGSLIHQKHCAYYTSHWHLLHEIVQPAVRAQLAHEGVLDKAAQCIVTQKHHRCQSQCSLEPWHVAMHQMIDQAVCHVGNKHSSNMLCIDNRSSNEHMQEARPQQ